MDNRFKNQVALLLRILPEIAREKNFALHGGTAINLFYHDMPRLSVDADLTYIPFGNREDDLFLIKEKLCLIRNRLIKVIPSVTIKAPDEIGDDLKLFCSIPGALVKVEVNIINRGITDSPVLMTLCKQAQNIFDSFCEIQVVPIGQLFGGKIVAALDRQHPRDLFDVKKLFESSGYTEEIHKGVMFCLLSSKRPFHEILQPSPINQKIVLESQFSGMTNDVFSYEMFEATRKLLVEVVNSHLSMEDKALLMSFAEGIPLWPDKDYSIYPGVRWKLLNIKRLKESDPKKFQIQLSLLNKILS